MLGIKACAPITRLWIANFLGTSYLPLVEGRTENRKDEDCTKSQGPFVAVSESLKSQTLLSITGTCSLEIHPGIRNTEHFMQDVVTDACNHSTTEEHRSNPQLLRVHGQPQLQETWFQTTPSLFFLPSTNIRLLYYYITKTTVLRVNVRLDHWLAEILKNCQT